MPNINISYKKEIDKINISVTENELRILRLCTGAMSQNELKKEWIKAEYGLEKDAPSSDLMPLYLQLDETVRKIDKDREDEI